MSNAIRLDAVQIGRLDQAAAQRQFRLSIIVGLAVLAVAAAHQLRPAHGESAYDGLRHQYVSAPQFVAARAAVPNVVRPSAVVSLASAD